MKLMQLNIWSGRLLYPLLGQIRENIKPDILCMQEVVDLRGPSGNVFATLDDIQNASGLKQKYMSPNLDFKFMHRRAFYGNAILSRFSVAQKETFFTHGHYISDFDYGERDDDNIRNVQHIQLEKSGINILNTHGYHDPNSKSGNNETIRQTKMLLEYTSKLEGPIIICGDFNLSPDSESIKLLSNKYTNLTAEAGATSTYSKINWNNTIYNWDEVVCDYIFVNEQVKVNDFHIMDEVMSDHKALVLDFETGLG